MTSCVQLAVTRLRKRRRWSNAGTAARSLSFRVPQGRNLFARHSREGGTAEAGCRSEHSRSEWPEGRATEVARNPAPLLCPWNKNTSFHSPAASGSLILRPSRPGSSLPRKALARHSREGGNPAPLLLIFALAPPLAFLLASREMRSKQSFHSPTASGSLFFACTKKSNQK